MAGVTAEIGLSIIATLTGSNDLGTPKQRVAISKSIQLEAGTDAVNKADILFSDTRTLAASASEDLDLSGVLANAFGATVTAAEIVAIYIAAATGNTNNVVFGPGAANGFSGPFGAATDRVAVKPGEFALLASRSGWTVAAGTGDILAVANSGSGTSVIYDILVIGRTVAA